MKIICIGRNYSDHIKELKNEVPEDMVIFQKPSTAIHKKNHPWFIPSFSNDVHYECEIVLKICKNGKHIQEQFAENYFQEISLGIDFTARDLQSKLKSAGLPWEKAKAFDRSALVGSFLPKSEFNMENIEFQLLKNNEQVQMGQSKKMIYSFEKIISEVSKYFTLQMGDLIFTGTPSGVGKVESGDQLTGVLKDEEVFNLHVK